MQLWFLPGLGCYFSGTEKCWFKILPHMRHGKIPSWNSPSFDCSKDGTGRNIVGPAVGSSLFRSKRTKEVGLCGNFIPVPHVLDPSEKNKQLRICNYKVKESHIGPGANLANWVLKQSALMLSESMLWPFNQSLHLEKIKRKYNKKKSKVILKPEWAIVQRSDVELLSGLYIPDLEGYLKSMTFFIGRISLIHISGARLTLCNTLYGPGFLEL